MPELSWETAEYQQRSGRWAPRVVFTETVPGGLEIFPLTAPRDHTFSTRQAAKKYSIRMAEKCLRAKGELNLS